MTARVRLSSLHAADVPTTSKVTWPRRRTGLVHHSERGGTLWPLLPGFAMGCRSSSAKIGLLPVFHCLLFPCMGGK